MLRRRALACLLGAPLLLRAQPRVLRLGFLGHGQRTAMWDSLLAGLRELGYVEGKNVHIERQWSGADNARLPAMAAEMVGRKVDIITAEGTPATLAAKKATSTIPVVMIGAGDALASGIVDSLARPGGNITGMTILSGELMAKRLELLKEALPGIRNVAAIINPTNPVQEVSWQAMRASADTLKVAVQRHDARTAAELESAFAAMARQQAEALVIPQDGLYIASAKAIAALALQHRIPSIGFVEYGEAGGLIGYGADLAQVFRRGAYFIDRIAKGAKPGELPVERPANLQLVVNAGTARALGVRIPPGILFRANRAIE